MSSKRRGTLREFLDRFETVGALQDWLADKPRDARVLTFEDCIVLQQESEGRVGWSAKFITEKKGQAVR
jgi:hypothetical protein